jgi:predicted dehydrogenase
MLGVGIIGAGWWAGEHARAVLAVPEARLVACSSRNPERLAAFRHAYGCAGETDYRRLLERPDIDAVAIAVPHDAHATIAIEALQAGKHVLLEKPMAPSRQECAAIATVARQSATRFMLGLTHHFIPAVAAARAIVERGELGRVVAGLCAHTRTWGWRGRPAFYRERSLGGGIWLTLGVHFVDRLLWLIESEVAGVSGTLARRFHDPTEHAADDVATATLRFASGATGTIILAGYRDGPDWNELHLIGERGGLRLDGRGLAVAHGQAWQSVAVDEANPMEVEWRAFARAIMAGTPPPVTLEHALRVMDVVFAVEEAAGRDAGCGMRDTGGRGDGE